MINIAIFGYGVVGSGVSEVIRKNSNSINRRAGDEINVKYIVDIRNFSDSPDAHLITNDSGKVFSDDSVNIVVETIGGIGVAYDFTRSALESGKHVVTSNKELVATHGPELLQLARDKGVNYLFEASVGGGIPIIRPLYQCLAANEITSITGILNGTTNYILTQMYREGKDFAEALKEAQQNGYAEANPTADVEGHDACRKIAILSSIAYGEFVDYNKIHTEGITKISRTDMEYAGEMDSVIKLIAHSQKVGNKIFARVSPALVGKSHPLANVEDVFNAIVVSGDAIGEVMFYGRGAGKLPTASAVVADVIDIVTHRDGNNNRSWIRMPHDNTLPIGQSEVRYFIRVDTRNLEEARNFISEDFGKCEFIRLDNPDAGNEFGFVTLKSTEKDLKARVTKLNGIGSIKNLVNIIRIVE